MKKRKIIIALLLFFITAFLVSYFAIRKAYNDNVHMDFKPISHTGEDDEISIPKGKDRINVLILGMEQTRTDMIMVATFNPEQKTLDVISLPRDIYVDRSVKHSTLKKLNSLYEFPSAEGGVERLGKEVSRLLGIPIHDYVMIDYNAVGQIVDAVGGIDVNIPFTMYYDDPYSKPPLHIYFPKGYTVLDGSNAIKYLRWRQNNDGTHGAEGDEGRIKRHQAFIQKLLDKALNPTMLPKVVEVAFNNVKTSLEFDQVSGLITDAALVKKEDIHFYHAVGVNAYFKPLAYSDALWYFLVDEERTQTLMQKIIHYAQITDDDLNPSKSFEVSALNKDMSNSYSSTKTSTTKKTVEETKQQNLNTVFEQDTNNKTDNKNNDINNQNRQTNENAGNTSPTDEEINNSVTDTQPNDGSSGQTQPDTPILDTPQPSPPPSVQPEPQSPPENPPTPEPVSPPTDETPIF